MRVEIMRFYIFRKKPSRDGKYPLGTTNENPGCKIINCPVCRTKGLLPKCRCGRLDVEILVKAIGYLEDIKQASTVLLVSKKVREVISQAGLTGAEFYPPVGYRTRGRKPAYQEMIRQCRDDVQYEVIHVTGDGGSVAETSGVRLEESCDVCGWRAYTLPENGFVIDESQWDGSDFFHVKEFGPFFISERAADILYQGELSNFFAQLSTDYRPGKLPRYDA